MTEFVLGLFIGAAVGFMTAAFLVAGSRADDDAEVLRLRAALGHLMRSSREPIVRRYIERVLDPAGDEAGS